MPNMWMIIYIIAALAVGLMGLTYFLSNRQYIAAILFFIGALTLMILFGMSWFEGDNSVFSDKPKQWPPYINTCPDYLTYFKRTKAGQKIDTCVDRIGVSKNNKLTLFPADGNVDQNNDAFFYPLATTNSDANKKIAELCARTVEYGLTWEGVTDGESCFTPGTGQAGEAAAVSPVPATPGCPTI